MTEWLDSTKPNVRPSTHTRYGFDVRRINAVLGNVKLTDLDSKKIQDFLKDLSVEGLSARSITHCRTVFSIALGQAEDWGLIGRNPAAGKRVRVPRISKHEVEALTPDEARNVITAFAGHPLEALVITAMGTGLREGELLGLRWNDVDLDAGTLTVRYQLQTINGERTYTEPKSKASCQHLALPDVVIDALKRQHTRQLEARLRAGNQWNETNVVFTTKGGTPFWGSNVLHSFQKHLADAGLRRMTIHELRHGAASLLLAGGSDIRSIMEFLRHSQISQTANTYTHVSATMKRDAADRLNVALTGTK